MEKIRKRHYFYIYTEHINVVYITHIQKGSSYMYACYSPRQYGWCPGAVERNCWTRLFVCAFWRTQKVFLFCNGVHGSWNWCKADIRNPLSLLAHERSRFATCQWELLTPTDISIPLTHRLVLYALEAGECLFCVHIILGKQISTIRLLYFSILWHSHLYFA